MTRLQTEWSRYLEVLLLIPSLRQPPRLDGRLEEWTPRHRVPPLDLLHDRSPPGDLLLGWRSDGLYVALDLPASGRARWIRQPLSLELLLDTRPRPDKQWDETCHHFIFQLRDGRGWLSIPPAAARNPETAELEARPDLPTAAGRADERYTAEFALPAEALYRYRGRAFQEIRIAFRYLSEGETVVGGSLPDLPHAERRPGCWPTVRLTEGE